MLAVPGNVVVPPNSAVMTGGSCESLGSLGYDSTVEDAQCPYPREKDTTGTAVQEEPAKKPPCMDSHDKSPKKLGSGGTSESPEKDTPGRHSQATEKDSPGEPAQKPPKMHSHDKGLKKLVLARSSHGKHRKPGTPQKGLSTRGSGLSSEGPNDSPAPSSSVRSSESKRSKSPTYWRQCGCKEFGSVQLLRLVL